MDAERLSELLTLLRQPLLLQLHLRLVLRFLDRQLPPLQRGFLLQLLRTEPNILLGNPQLLQASRTLLVQR